MPSISGFALDGAGGAGIAPIAPVTKAVVAMLVELSPGAAVGAVGLPVNAGLTSNAPPTAVTSVAWRVTAPVRVLNEATPVVEATTALMTKAVVAS